MNTLTLAAGLSGMMIILGSACVPVVVAGAGVAAYHYSEGELEYSVYANVDKSRKAVAAVIKERGWTVKEERRDVTTAYCRCITADGTEVRIDISRRSHEFTRVAVRYGVFGDEAESKKFIEQVKARL